MRGARGQIWTAALVPLLVGEAALMPWNSRGDCHCMDITRCSFRDGSWERSCYRTHWASLRLPPWVLWRPSADPHAVARRPGRPRYFFTSIRSTIPRRCYGGRRQSHLLALSSCEKFVVVADVVTRVVRRRSEHE
jgi:hypothetical protein